LRALLLLTCFSALPAHEELCDVESSMPGRSLLQVHADRTAEKKSSDVPALPEHLQKLGVQLFGSQQALNDVVDQSHEVSFSYASIPMTARMMQGDNAETRLGEEGGAEYGLDTLRDLRPQGQINMIDLGGNLGSTVIAVAKLYPNEVHALVVEPVPTTYFFLRWNLWLNSVDDLSDVHHSKALTATPGVKVLHAGVDTTEGSSLTICSQIGNSMNSFIKPHPHLPCNCGVDATCSDVQTVTMRSLLSHFGTDTITLLKADCEGCEMKGFQDLISLPPGRILRLCGELHEPTQSVLDVACTYDSSRYFTAFCAINADARKYSDFDRVNGVDVCSRCKGKAPL